MTREEFQGMKMQAIKPSGMIRKEAKERGFEIDDMEFRTGSDWLWLRNMFPKGNDMPLQVKYNTTNGRFFAYTPFCGDVPTTEADHESESEPWYARLLLLLYAPYINKGDRVTVKARGLLVRGTVVSAEWYRESGWYIEMTDANVPGGYSYWKQRDDGGTLVSWSGLPASEVR